MIRWMSEISVVKEGMGNETRMYNKKWKIMKVKKQKRKLRRGH